jgi:hypothetical protein
VIVRTSNCTLPAFTITELYRCRWQVEWFFKWITQHLRINAVFGTSEHAVKSQLWIAVSVSVLVAIVKKRLTLSTTLSEMLQIFSLPMFERLPLDQRRAQAVLEDTDHISDTQLIVSEERWDTTESRSMERLYPLLSIPHTSTTPNAASPNRTRVL